MVLSFDPVQLFLYRLTSERWLLVPLQAHGRGLTSDDYSLTFCCIIVCNHSLSYYIFTFQIYWWLVVKDAVDF